jgi:hypothetical protein
MVAPIRRFLLSLPGPFRRRLVGRSLPTSPLGLVTDAPPIIARELQGRVVTGPPLRRRQNSTGCTRSTRTLICTYTAVRPDGYAGRYRIVARSRSISQDYHASVPRPTKAPGSGVMEDRLAGAPPGRLGRDNVVPRCERLVGATRRPARARAPNDPLLGRAPTGLSRGNPRWPAGGRGTLWATCLRAASTAMCSPGIS